jgi:hypothetical protein
VSTWIPSRPWCVGEPLYRAGMVVALADRPIDFSYDLIGLACPGCSSRVEFSFAEYCEGSTIQCPVCRAGVTSQDPLEMLLADTDDPVLNTNRVEEFAWYHTTTREAWPPTGRGPSDDALHLGTYEAAIENMVRGMARQSRADEQFYLNRVRIRVDADRIVGKVVTDPGAAFTGRVPLSKVRGHDRELYDNDSDFLVLRYLNKHEHRGRISLAVDPVVVVEVQTIPVPRNSVANAEAIDAQRVYEHTNNEIEAAWPDPERRRSLDLMLDLKLNWDDPFIQAVNQLEKRSSAARTLYWSELRRSYLPGVGDYAYDYFEAAIGAMTTSGIDEVHEKYRALAGAFNDYSGMITAATEQIRVAPNLTLDSSTPPIMIPTGDFALQPNRDDYRDSLRLWI